MTNGEPDQEDVEVTALLDLTDTPVDPDKTTPEQKHYDPLLLASSSATIGRTKAGHFWNSPRKRLSQQLSTALGTAPDDVAGAFMSLIAECDLYSFDTRRSSRWWGRAYYLLGLPAAVLAAVAAATGLISAAGRVPAAIIALVASGLTAAATFLNSQDNQKRNNLMSAAWSELGDDARLQHLSYVETGRRSSDPMHTTTSADTYWSQLLKLHQRKGRLLRGDLTSTGESLSTP
jgi:hypothetical protein